MFFNDGSNLIGNIMTFYGLNNRYFADGKYNESSGEYWTRSGKVIKENWFPGQPDTTYECVGINASGQYLTMNCSEDAQYGCQFWNSRDDFLVNVKNTRYAVGLTHSSYSESVLSCDAEDGRLLQYHPKWRFLEVLQRFYRKIGITGLDYWFELPDGHTIENGVVTPGDGITSSCPALRVSNVTSIVWTSCNDDLHYLCEMEYKETFLDTSRHCAPGYERFDVTTCLRYYPIPVPWKIAYATCLSDTGDEGALFRFIDDEFDNASVLKYYIKTLSVDENVDFIWTGMCGNGYKIGWKSKITGTGDEYPVPDYVYKDDCVLVNMKKLNLYNSTDILDDSYSHPFICEHRSLRLPKYMNTSFPLNTTVHDNIQLLSFPDYCPSGFHAYEESCVRVLETTYFWTFGNYYCKVAVTDGQYMVNDNSSTGHEILETIIKANQWFISKKFWIGISNMFTSEFTHQGTYLPLGDFTAWESEETSSKSGCVAMNNLGKWEVLSCSSQLPYLCQAKQCYRYKPSSYKGTVSTTANGLKCQRWDSKRPHSHNMTLQPYHVENYCRDDGSYYGPWCFTESPDMRFEICGIKECGIGHPFPYYIEVEEKYSEFIPASDERQVSVECDNGQAMVNCECSNEHCLGVEIITVPSENSFMSSHQHFSCVETSTSATTYKVKTRAKAYCIPSNDTYFVTQSLVTTSGKNFKVFCPAPMKMSSCAQLNPDPLTDEWTLGIGRKTVESDGVEVCQSQSCHNNNCTVTTLCSLINRKGYKSNAKHVSYHVRAINIPSLQEPIEKQLTSAFFVYDFDEIHTLCFWVKVSMPEPSVPLLGTLAYLARTYQFPVLAMAGGNTSDSGVFIAPNAERLVFDPTALLDGNWHLITFTFGTILESENVERCQLYIDTDLAAETKSNKPCGKDLLLPMGHFAIGRGADVFTPWVSDDDENNELMKTSLNSADERLFRQPFAGHVGDFSVYTKPLSQADIRQLFMWCAFEDWHGGDPPSEVKETYSYASFSKTSSVMYLYGNVETSRTIRPCSEAMSAFHISVKKQSMSVASSYVNLTFSYEVDNYAKLQKFGVVNYQKIIYCVMSGFPENSFTLNKTSPIHELSEIFTETTTIENLQSGSDYECHISSLIDLFAAANDKQLLPFTFTTALGQVLNISSVVNPESSIPSFELLSPGTDFLTWKSPSRGSVDQYNISSYQKFSNGSWVFMKQELESALNFIQYAVNFSTAFPGAQYRLVISAVHDGIDGDPAVFESRLQPDLPILQEAHSEGHKSHVNLKIKWSDPYNNYIEGYELKYKKYPSGNWVQVDVEGGKTEFIIFGLSVQTTYQLSLSSYSGLKATNSSDLIIKTGLGGGIYFLEMQRTSETSVLMSWNVYDNCHEYQVGIEAVRELGGSVDDRVEDSNCFFAPSIFYKILNNIKCDAITRRFQNYMYQEVLDLKKGCVYRAFVKHINEENIVEFALESEFDNPNSVSVVKGLSLSSSSDNSLQLSWSEPDIAENVDRFFVTLSLATTPHLQYRVTVVSVASVDFFNLTEGTKYIVNVTAARGKESGPSPASLTAWTKRFNSSSLYAWSKWSSYSQCSQTCGDGLLMSRKRMCQNPDLETSPACYMGDLTLEEDTEIEECTLAPCPIDGQWSEWSSYSMCDVSCGGGGFQTRNRTCSNPSPSYGGRYCEGGDLWKEEIRKCGDNPCPIHGGWTPWVNALSCSVTCGEGTQIKKRFCRNPVPQNGGMDCVGESETAQLCSNEPCPVDGQWQEWTSWTECLNTCGFSNSTRERSCTRSSTGHWCPGVEFDKKDFQVKLCIASQPCGDDFHWGSWSLFSSCSETCGTSSTRQRTRKCVWNNKMYEEARPCEDVEVQWLMCGPKDCPVHGSWAEWSNWSPCSVSCGKGIEVRLRLCDNPAPSFAGLDCEGSDTGSQQEQRECDSRACPSQRYLNSPTSLRHCKPEKGVSGIKWEWSFVGTNQNQSCPVGTSGQAFRKCGQNEQWQAEDLAQCVSDKMKKIVDYTENVKTGSSTSFRTISKELLQLLDGDSNGQDLSVSGDILNVHNLLEKLLSWKPSYFSDLSRAAKLEYVDTITTSVEKITHLKYKNLWKGMNGTLTLKMLKNFLSLVETTSKYGLDVIESDTSVIYKNNFNENFNLLLQTSKTSDAKTFTFPAYNSPEYKLEKSTISIQIDPSYADQEDEDKTVKVMFVKYSTMSKFIDEMNEKITNETKRSFEGRKLNSVLIGAMLRYSGMEEDFNFQNKIRIVFHHIRKAKDPLCVFIDEREGKWLYNEGGCQVDIIDSSPETTVCLCDHLTTFAVLTHDVMDIEMEKAIERSSFRHIYSIVSLVSVACLFVVLVLVFIPIHMMKMFSCLPVHTILSCLIRHGSVYCIVEFSTSSATCSITASVFVYACMANSTLLLINCLDILLEVRCGRRRCQDNYYLTSWVLPLFLTLKILITYGISTSKDLFLTCSEIYSTTMLASAMALSAFALLFTFVLMVHTIRSFAATNMKPLEANRTERRLWLMGLLLVISSANIILLFLSFVGYSSPSHDIQMTYACLVTVEIIFLAFTHLWMDTEVRAYYYRKFGAKPVQEKVKAQPPKYIP